MIRESLGRWKTKSRRKEVAKKKRPKKITCAFKRTKKKYDHHRVIWERSSGRGVRVARYPKFKKGDVEMGKTNPPISTNIHAFALVGNNPVHPRPKKGPHHHHHHCDEVTS